jgi:hypothetical protein
MLSHVSSGTSARSRLYHFIEIKLKAFLQVDEFTYASLVSWEPRGDMYVGESESKGNFEITQ